jgi:7-cyano-7-deazaguanine reductase
MTRMGETVQECKKEIEARVKRDLSELLGGAIHCNLFLTDRSREYSFKYPRIQDISPLEQTTFDTYKSDHTQLQTSGKKGSLKVSIDFLRSNCRVTNQPDFGDMLIYMKGDQLPELQSLAKYVVSHRQVNHFHEEIAEMTYVHLMEKFNPKELMVTCLYSRRGGIEINPTRASDPKLIPSWLYLKDTRFKKTLKQ